MASLFAWLRSSLGALRTHSKMCGESVQPVAFAINANAASLTESLGLGVGSLFDV